MIATGLWEPENDGRTDDPEPVIGWRTWVVNGGRLTALSRHATWQPGENRAQCFARGCADVPGPGCHCGFWALSSPVAAMHIALAHGLRMPVAVGLIRGYGEIATHGMQGFRAEYASITCLFTDAPQAERPSIDMVAEIADHYGVPHPTLEAALSIGLLQELGVEPQAIVELHMWLKSGRPFPRFEHPPMPPRPPLKAA